MKKNTKFECEFCGYQTGKWMGKCPDCNSWNSFIEIKEEKNHGKSARFSSLSKEIQPLPLTKVEKETISRIETGISEFDRSLGGGFVPGSLILIGGEPGIGKSTLMLQVCKNIADKEKKVLYFSGEESPSQIKMRGERINSLSDNILMSGEITIDGILKLIESESPALVIIDSIQTMYSPQLTSAPGTVSQIREATHKFLMSAKSSNIPFVVIGHITKEGSIAGPKTLEHIVDTVLYFEGERFHSRRIIRAVKNRFGSTNEIGIFEMTEKGLIPIKNPSEIFISERTPDTTGSSIISAIEGSRALLVEIQALVSETSFGNPRRMAIGVDVNRLQMLLAIMEKRLDFAIQRDDVYVNAAGGFSINEPAADLGIAFAVASSFLEKPLKAEDVFIGEVGLSGELRTVSQIEKRVKEAKSLGFKKVYLPHTTNKQITKLNSKNFQIILCNTLKEAFVSYF
jgi:DNA repair protein RadA/Sms